MFRKRINKLNEIYIQIHYRFIKCLKYPIDKNRSNAKLSFTICWSSKEQKQVVLKSAADGNKQLVSVSLAILRSSALNVKTDRLEVV